MPGRATLVAMLRESARRNPDHPAFIQGDGTTVTYRAFCRDVCATADALHDAGVQPGDRVGILFGNCADYGVAYYAAFAVGAIAVGLDAAQEAAALERNLAHCEPSVLLAPAGSARALALQDKLPSLRRVMPVQRGGAALGDREIDEPRDPSAPAAIIYTSGTTGEPRGVTLSHRNLAANTRAIIQYLELSPADRTMSALPFFHTYGNSVLHSHLAAGATLLLAESLAYPHVVVKRMEAERATGFAGVAASYALLLRRVDLAAHDLSSLRYLTQAGSAISPTLVDRLLEALPHARLFRMYGQTEATARITWLPPERLHDKPGSVGVPVAGVELQVRDRSGRRLPAGKVGEVHVRGDSVMLGYWNAPEATAAVLKDGWLATGDLGRLDPEGFLTLEGRAKDQIKSGAHRISPDEIEAVVTQMSGIVECAAIGVPDDILGEVVRLHVVIAAGQDLTGRAIQAHCRQHLPVYMVPKQVVFSPALPRTPSGKVQRFRLREYA